MRTLRLTRRAGIATLAIFLLCSASLPAAANMEGDAKESYANALIEWLNERRARLESNPDIFLLHSLVLEPCLQEKLTEATGSDFLYDIPNIVRILYLEVSKLATPEIIADLEYEMLNSGMKPMDFIAVVKSGC